MITLANLRALLERAMTHAENTAIVRLADRTVEGVARAYLPRTVWRSWVHDGPEDFRTIDDIRSAVHVDWAERRTLDLTEPGTSHALLVALALALGLDPGVGGLCGWRRSGGGLGWILHAADVDYWFHAWEVEACNQSAKHAPTVAGETDPLKALVLAARYVLEHP